MWKKCTLKEVIKNIPKNPSSNIKENTESGNSKIKLYAEFSDSYDSVCLRVVNAKLYDSLGCVGDESATFQSIVAKDITTEAHFLLCQAEELPSINFTLGTNQYYLDIVDECQWQITQVHGNYPYSKNTITQQEMQTIVNELNKNMAQFEIIGFWFYNYNIGYGSKGPFYGTKVNLNGVLITQKDYQDTSWFPQWTKKHNLNWL